MNRKNEILHEILNMGEAMLANGAEVNRVEDTINRMGAAYGAIQMDVFVITSCMVVTMVFSDDSNITETRRITKALGTDFKKLEDLNALSRQCCEQPMPLEELRSRLQKITSCASERLYFYLGSMLAAGSFTLFFGGSFLDSVAAVVFAVMICFLQEYLMPYCTNRMVFNLISSIVTGLCICLLARMTSLVHMDKIIIGDIMLLIPGIAMTNAVRDILVGDTISGIMKLVESLLWAGTLACGFMAAIWLIGG